MITAIVEFQLPHPISLEEARDTFQSTAPKYLNMPGLVRKYYFRTEDGAKAGGIYLWKNKQAALAVYTDEWKPSSAVSTVPTPSSPSWTVQSSWTTSPTKLLSSRLVRMQAQSTRHLQVNTQLSVACSWQEGGA